jgi:hypothetical protein
MDNRTHLLIVTALGEGGTGLLLLAWPAIPRLLLLGGGEMSPDGAFTGRVAGAALVALAIACWLGRADRPCRTQEGLLWGLLTYDLAAAAILAGTGASTDQVGIALWPAVLLHAGLAGWCVGCLRARPSGPPASSHPKEGAGS